MGAFLAVYACSCGLAACADEPSPPPIEMPAPEVFQLLRARAPTARVALPFALEAQSCTFAHYTTHSRHGEPMFALLHPQRSLCELWLGLFDVPFQYCRFSREPRVIRLGEPDTAALVVDDSERCVISFGAPDDPRALEAE